MPKGTNFRPSEKLAAEIRELYEHGFTIQSIANFVGVSIKAIDGLLIRHADHHGDVREHRLVMEERLGR